jgi:hypothetical protein
MSVPGHPRRGNCGTVQRQGSLRRVVFLIVVTAAALPAAALPATADAKRATVKGTVAGIKVPRPGSGEAWLRALNVDSGALTGSATISRRGRFKVSVPAGKYAFLAASLRFPGGSFVDRLVGAARLKAGKTTKLKPPAKRPKARASQGPILSGIGDVSVGYPAIWVKRFEVTGGGPDFAVLDKGLGAYMTTSLVPDAEACGAGGRKYAVVERERIKDVLAELRRSQSKYFDPATRPARGKIIKDNATVTGKLVVTGGQAALSATYTETGGYTATVTTRGAATELFELADRLAAAIIKKICKPSPALPTAFEGTVSGSFSQPSDSSYQVNQQWTGTARFAQTAGDPGSYEPVAGTLTYSTSGSDDSGCSYSGTGVVAIAPATVFGSLGLSSTTYFLAGYWTNDEVIQRPTYPVTVACPEGTTSEVMPVQLKWLGTDPAGEQIPADAGTVSGTRTEIAPNGVQTVWTWNLIGE